jgi:hypothetical protein
MTASSNLLTTDLAPDAGFDLASPTLSIFAFGELSSSLSKLKLARLLLSSDVVKLSSLIGGASERDLNQIAFVTEGNGVI